MHCAMSLPPPPYSDGSTGSGGSMGGYNRSNRSEHIYESPKFLRKLNDTPGEYGTGASGAGPSSPTEYYELDPDMSNTGMT